MSKFRRIEHIRDSLTIRRTLKGGKRYSSRDLNVYILKNGLNFSRMCSLVRKRYFKGAVERNRIRRLHREIFRAIKDNLTAPCDMIIEAKGLCKGIKYNELRGQFCGILQRVGLLIRD